MIATPKRPAGARASAVLRPHEQHFRGSLGRFATGVAVVTFDTDQGRHGITVNSFTSVSLEPPLVLVSIARTTKSHDELAGRPFTVNVLGAEQRALASNFGGTPTGEPRWVEGTVAPRLAGVLSYFECTPASRGATVPSTHRGSPVGVPPKLLARARCSAPRTLTVNGRPASSSWISWSGRC